MTPNTCTAICGNGRKDGTEVCDDGNLVSGDGCKNDCTATEPGWTCVTNPAVLSTCTPICSAANLYVVGNLKCSDGNIVNGDGCDATCQIEPGWTCDTNPNKATTPTKSLCT